MVPVVMLLFLMALIGSIALLDIVKPKGNRPSARALRELGSLAVTTIAAARVGRVKLRGVARGQQSEVTLAGQIPCVALRRTTTISAGRRVTYRTEERMYPFELDDGTGTIAVDLRDALLDYELITTGDSREECLREGATLAVIGTLVASAEAAEARTPLRFAARPLVSWRCDPEDAPRRGLRSLLPIVAPLMPFGGMAGLVACYVTGSTEDCDIIVYVAPLVPVVVLIAAIGMFKKRVSPT